jgi:hypothetical protein
MAKHRVRAAVKNVLIFGEGSPDDHSAEGFHPPDPEHFGFNAQVFIGESTNERYDSFDLVVCTPSWFAQQVAEGSWDRFRNGGSRVVPESVVVGASLWFMRRWAKPDFDSAVLAVTEAASPGPDWGSVANRIGRSIPWEFDYKYDTHLDDHYGEPFPPVA